MHLYINYNPCLKSLPIQTEKKKNADIGRGDDSTLQGKENIALLI